MGGPISELSEGPQQQKPIYPNFTICYYQNGICVIMLVQNVFVYAWCTSYATIRTFEMQRTFVYQGFVCIEVKRDSQQYSGHNIVSKEGIKPTEALSIRNSMFYRQATVLPYSN